MTPVYQTEYGPTGNCFAACVATAIGCELSEVPDVRTEDGINRLLSWLSDKGWIARFHRPRGGQTPGKGFAIRSGKTLTGDAHAVLYQDGRQVHDPSPRPWAIRTTIVWTVLRRTT